MSAGRGFPGLPRFFSWADLHASEIRLALRAIDGAAAGLVGLPQSTTREVAHELEELRREVEGWRRETPGEEAQITVLRRASAVRDAVSVMRRSPRDLPESGACRPLRRLAPTRT
jgi:hypothetical protein